MTDTYNIARALVSAFAAPNCPTCEAPLLEDMPHNHNLQCYGCCDWGASYVARFDQDLCGPCERLA